MHTSTTSQTSYRLSAHANKLRLLVLIAIYFSSLCTITTVSAEEDHPGKLIFQTYCAACHGPQGAGLVGPNLTDTVFINGGKKADVLRVVTDGVAAKGMPTWSLILQPQQINDVVDFTFGLIGQNLKSPFAPGESSVTSFPKGSLAFPLLMRTFMPLQGLSEDIFVNHSRGMTVSKYSPDKGDVKGDVNPIKGIPTAIAVNFGEQLSYCFDGTECRLLYTWSGNFMDMTKYWGKGSGGGRKAFGYVPDVMGTMAFVTNGPEPMQMGSKVKPKFLGYRKVQNVPEFIYQLGPVKVTQRIVPGKVAGEAVCHYTTEGVKQDLTFEFDKNIADQITCDKGKRDGARIVLSSSDAAAFAITIAPMKK